MNLNLAWPAPSPVPNCGYKALYRRKGDPTYTEMDTSGTTAIIPVGDAASYEGKIVSDCCSESQSSGVPFGVNAYSALSAEGVLNIVTGVLTVTASSSFANPYDTLVTATVHYMNNLSGTTTVISGTYPAGSTSHVIYTGDLSGQSVTSVVITAIAPVFDNGGQLQQFDSVNTPPYFKFYASGDISGTTWDGGPISLPSFTLDSFIVTELSPDASTVLAGNLNFSYILDEVFSNSFTSIDFEIIDLSSLNVIGSASVSQTPLGLRNVTIALTKDVSDLSELTEFKANVLLPDLTLLSVRHFYLPSF